MAWMKPVVLGLALAVLSAACSFGSDEAPRVLRGSPPATSPPMLSSEAPPSPPASPSIEANLPPPDRPIPPDPAGVARALTETTEELHRAVDAWTTGGHPTRGGAPDDVVLLALYQQRMYRFLARHHALADLTLRLLRGRLRAGARANVRAAAELFSIVRPISRPSRFRTGPPQPAGVLLRWFLGAERRFGVDWELLAAVMYVESKFGRVRSASFAGAQGPMQFIPSTWATYGMGGEVHDPRDSIIGRPTTCTTPDRRPMTGGRCSPTTTPGSTWTPCSATPTR